MARGVPDQDRQEMGVTPAEVSSAGALRLASKRKKQAARDTAQARKTGRLNAASACDRGRGARDFWQIPKTGWRDIAVRTWTETNADNISLLAAGVAFYSFLAFVPLLASIVLVYRIVANPADVADHMATLMRLLPSDAANIIAEQLQSLTATPVTRTTIGLIVAILLALYGAMRGATPIIGALNITYGEHEKRSLVHTTLLSLAFTVGAVVVALVATVALGAMGLIGTIIRLPPAAGPSITTGLWVGTALVASLLIGVVYRYGPDRNDARWMWLTPGAVFARVGALLATVLFGLYVSHFAGYTATCEALGAVVSFLMWLYVSAFVQLLGAELNAEIEHQTARDTTQGVEKQQDMRGAKMADETAGLAAWFHSEDWTDRGDEAARHAEPAPARAAPIVADFAAARLTQMTSDVRVGTLSMTLLSAGLAMVGPRGRAKTGLACLAGRRSARGSRAPRGGRSTIRQENGNGYER
jgi:membrane protein